MKHKIKPFRRLKAALRHRLEKRFGIYIEDNQKTISADQLSTTLMGNGEDKECRVIKPVEHLHVFNYVGIGWVDEGPADNEQMKKYPLVIYEDN